VSNDLAKESSPYLLQHAENPVDWHPWCAEALQQARGSDKPILLSIGYSACHWCHVMAHECFEDPAVAALMNDLFVNIKVDREERPDIDRIYQLAHQLYTGRGGGWPLTVFLTPAEHVPIFIGTYFPKEARYGMPAFGDVLERVETYYRTHRNEIAESGHSLRDAFAKLDSQAADASGQLTRAPIDAARQALGGIYDKTYGGFGNAPKFPHPTDLELLLAIARPAPDGAAEDPEALEIVMHSLSQMARHGLYDQLGGGFFRYSVDRAWSIPHFEKMLYDNASLLALYSDAYAATGDACYARVAAETADWALREMQAPDGGFFATLDADSDGTEGKFYVWTRADFDAALEPQTRRVAERFFGLNEPPNFEGESWHLHAGADVAEIAAASDLESSEAAARIEAAKRALLAARQRRVRPGQDEKRLVAWNGLMIRGLAKASRRLHRADLTDAATAAVDFIRRELWRDGRLLAVYGGGRGRFGAYLDDYAFLAAGLLELLQCRWRTEDLTFSTQLADAMLAHFEDSRGGFFFTADDHEALLHRPKPLTDDALPSGNGVAAQVLCGLGHLLGEPRYLRAAERTLRCASASIRQSPAGHASLLRALACELQPPALVIVRGEAAELDRWRQATDAAYAPERLAFFIPAAVNDLPGLLGERRAGAGTLAYLCAGTECRAPIADRSEFERALGTSA
jgi:hypothetical protein